MMRTEFTSAHQDTASGHEEEQSREQEGENLYVTIQEAARRCGVSDKTIQRAIRAGDLPAQYPKKNLCAIAVSDLATFMPGHVQTVTKPHLAENVSGHVQAEIEQRVAALERCVQQLEHLVTELLERPVAQIRQSKAKARKERTTGLLPKRFVSLLAFARLHNIAESTVQTHMDMGLFPVERGTWTDTDGMEVTLALDAKGRMAFYHLYQSFPQFMNCHHCFHGYQDSVLSRLHFTNDKNVDDVSSPLHFPTS
jgi:excisionase family DNA binding protein